MAFSRNGLLVVIGACLAGAFGVEGIHLLKGAPWPGFDRPALWADVVLLPLWLAGLIATVVQIPKAELKTGPLILIAAATLGLFVYGIMVRTGEETAGSATYWSLLLIGPGIVASVALTYYARSVYHSGESREEERRRVA
jgi:hypothetical protein